MCIPWLFKEKKGIFIGDDEIVELINI